MNCRLPVFFAAVLAVGAFGQVKIPPYYVPTAPNMNYAGLGSAVISPRVYNSFPSRLGATVRGGYPGYGYPGYGGASRGYGGVSHNVAHPNHSQQVIVPVPIVVGGGYYPYDSYGYGPSGYADPSMSMVPQQQQQPVTPPVVIINQSYRPETANPVLRDYSDSDLPAATGSVRSYDAPVRPMPDPGDLKKTRGVDEQQATIYLIAFKDHTIFPALAYWIDGDTLNYITQQGTHNRASLSLIDRAFSKQLNRERSVEFSLPED